MSRAINTITAATAADGATNLNIDSGTLFVNTTTNNVGIGTTSPACRLHLVAPDVQLRFTNGSSHVRHLGVVDADNSLRIARTDVADDVTINSSGNVGIGTASPAAKIHVQGAGTTSAAYTNGDAVGQTLYLQDTGNLAGNGGQILFGASQGVFAGIKSSIVSGTGPAGNLIFQTRDTTGNVLDRMTVTREGNVGIGTTSPAYKLEVIGTLKSSSAGGNLIFNADSGNEWWTGSWDDLVSYQITRRNNSSGIGASYLTISTSGDVGIGSSSPSAKLSISFNGTSVAGSKLINTASGSSAQNYAIFYRNTTTQIGSITGTDSAISYNTSSDYRLKTNLDPVVNGIERIKQLPVYRFNWINDQGANKVDGFVAHEAKLIVPECVVGEKDAVDADGNPIYQGIDQSKIVPLLTAALKEAIAKIETLESKVTALEAV